MSKAWKAALACTVVVAAGAGGVVYARSKNDKAITTAAKAPAKLATAKVVKKDLVTYDETTATLGFTTSVTVASPVDGTVTTIAKSGCKIAHIAPISVCL